MIQHPTRKPVKSSSNRSSDVGAGLAPARHEAKRLTLRLPVLFAVFTVLLLTVLLLTVLLLTVLSPSSPISAQAEPTVKPGAKPPIERVTELPVAVVLTPFRASGGKSAVHAWLEIPGEALARLSHQPSSAESGEIQLNVEVDALDMEGRSQASFSHPVELMGEQAEQAHDWGLKLHGRLELAPATYQLHLRVHDGSGTTQVDRKLPFEVKSYEPTQAAVLPPLFIDDDGDAVVLRRPVQDEALDPFLTATDETFVPKVVPVLEEGPSRARITLVGYHLKKDQSLLDAKLLNAEGSLLGKDRLGLVSQSETAADGLDRFDFSLQTEGLPPGDYQLEVSIQDFEFGRTDQTLMPFVIE